MENQSNTQPEPNPENNWQKYYEVTQGKERKVSGLAEAAVKYVKNKDVAIDLGAGSLRDSKFFVDSGFSRVIAYDKNSPDSSKLDEKYSGIIELDDRLFREFDYPDQTFDLIFSRASFHYIPPQRFDLFIKKIKKSLKPEGILAIDMLGPNDAWAHRSDYTFKSLEEIKDLLSDMEIVWIKEFEYDGKTALDNQLGNTKHWHTIKLIARKK